MRCFVITRKHIIIIICAIVFIVLGFVLYRNITAPTAAPAFKNSSPDKVISDILPTDSEPSLVYETKELISSATEINPIEILASYGGIFSKSYTPDDYHESSEIPESQASTEPSVSANPPPEEKTSTSAELIKNETPYNVSAADFANTDIQVSDSAEILIIHTHTTESYTPEIQSGLPDNSRSTDEAKNMIAIGNVFEKQLGDMGFKVVHDKTVHDYPSYQGAYGRSLATAKKHLNQNDKMQIILDIHRDAITKEDGTRVKLVKDVDGTKCAQMMLVCGTDSSGLSHTDWQNNLNFAIKIQHTMESSYPGLMRPINLREERFNQHLAPGALILEIGTHGNTITEAKNGAILLAEAIGKVLKS